MSGFTLVIDAFAGEPAVEVSRMFGSDAVKVGGKVFVMHVKGRLVVKLNASRAEELIASGKATAFDPGHGRPMKQWVAIGPEQEWMPLAREALEIASVKGAGTDRKLNGARPMSEALDDVRGWHEGTESSQRRAKSDLVASIGSPISIQAQSGYPRFWIVPRLAKERDRAAA